MLDALLVFSLIVVVMVAVAALSSVFGVDSREGFANERLRSTIR